MLIDEGAGDRDLLVVQLRVELGPLLPRLTEERAGLLDELSLRLHQRFQVRARLQELLAELVLQLHRDEAHREHGALSGADRRVELLLLLGTDLELRLERVEARQLDGRSAARDGEKQRREKNAKARESGHQNASLTRGTDPVRPSIM